MTLEILTPREREVLASLCQGHCNKRIARHLGISLGTVKIHLHNIYEKLGVGNRATLIVLAITSGVVGG